MFHRAMYVIAHPNFILVDGSLHEARGILYDRHERWERFEEKDLRLYFENGCAVFLMEIKKLQNLKRPPKPREKKTLRFMLEALLETKNFEVIRKAGGKRK